MLRPGERMGDWIVEARLGESDRGAVFLARHSLNLNLRGALKVAQPSDYSEARAAFVTEIEPLLTLQHEALIRVLGWGEDADRRMLWMTTELLRGQSLEERLSEGRPFSLEEVGFVFGRLAGVLALIHAHGAHHGDLRPSDVLIAEGRHIRLTGFGTVFRDGRQGRVDPESLAYVGPEYFDGPESCSPVAADIYALGLILYEALTGRRVFPLEPGLKAAPQVARLMGLKLRMGPLDAGDDAPLPLRRAVFQCTDPDPAARPGDLSGFLTALALATRDRQAEVPSAPPTAAPPAPEPFPAQTASLGRSVLGQRHAAFPFAPPGWGPRALQAPPPLAQVRQGAASAEVPEAGRVPEVHTVGPRGTQDERAPAAWTAPPPPVSERYGEPYDEPYGEPEVLTAHEEPEEGADERAAATDAGFTPEPATPVPQAPPEEPEEAASEEASPEEAGSEEGVLLDTAAPVLPESWDPIAPDDPQARHGAERPRSVRPFVPPPPVPDPSDVDAGARGARPPEVTAPPPDPPAPEPLESADLEAGGNGAGDREAYDLEGYDAVLPVAPPAPEAPRDLPVPVAPGSPEAVDEGIADPTWIDRYDDVPEPPAEILTPAPPECAAAETDSANGRTLVPEQEVSGEGLPAEDDWAWHEEESFHGDDESASLDQRPPIQDPYTPPRRQDYEDGLDPSASEIAADVFGDHPERATWVKRALVTAFLVIVTLGVVYVLRGRPDGARETGGARVEEPANPQVGLPEPPPAEVPPAEVPPIDLGAVVAAPAPEAAPAALPTPASRQAPGTATPAPRIEPVVAPGAAAPVATVPTAPGASPWVTAPPTAVPAAVPVAPVATGRGLMDQLRQGWSALDAGNLVGAQSAFMAALQDEPGNGMAHYGLGQVAERARDYTGASYHYGRAYQVLGQNPSMRGELEAALRRVAAKTGAQPAPTTPAATQAQPPATPEVQVTRKKRDDLEEEFRDELWDEDPTE